MYLGWLQSRAFHASAHHALKPSVRPPAQQQWLSPNGITENAAFLYITPWGFQAFYHKRESFLYQEKEIKPDAMKALPPKTEASHSPCASTKNRAGLSSQATHVN